MTQYKIVPVDTIEYEIIQDDMVVAGSTSPDGIRHYAAVYSQDGPVEIAQVFRTALNTNLETICNPLDDAELVERVARVIDPKSWTDDLPIPTRTRVVSFHAGRLTSIKKARAAIAAIVGGE